MSYTAPLKDMLFNIRHLAGIEQIAQMPGFEDAGFDTAQAVLEEAAKFNEAVLAPLTSFSRYTDLSSSEPAVNSASMAPSLNSGHSAKLRLALLHISMQAAPMVLGRP